MLEVHSPPEAAGTHLFQPDATAQSHLVLRSSWAQCYFGSLVFDQEEAITMNCYLPLLLTVIFIL